MAQHFVLSAASRPLPVGRVFRMSEDRAYAEFKKARWPDTGGRPPHCLGCSTVGATLYETARRRFRCAACRGDFTVTHGTIFASHKLARPQLRLANEPPEDIAPRPNRGFR